QATISPNADDVRCALQVQRCPSKHGVKSIFKLLAINAVFLACFVYIVSLTDFCGLDSWPSSFNAIVDSNPPIHLSLIFNPNSHAVYGGFKQALSGHTNILIFGMSSQACIKQCWYQCKSTSSHIPYENGTQVSRLSAEINCLRWAEAFMHIVHNFIAEGLESHANPPFAIPQMHFVKLALTIIENNNHDTYMIEEFIEELEDGKFRSIFNIIRHIKWLSLWIFKVSFKLDNIFTVTN
ncbi:hypothetical protein SERLA73DRAFT_47325, partial [Serpula lacrymans var. lacrymans S7.3]